MTRCEFSISNQDKRQATRFSSLSLSLLLCFFSSYSRCIHFWIVYTLILIHSSSCLISPFYPICGFFLSTLAWSSCCLCVSAFFPKVYLVKFNLFEWIDLAIGSLRYFLYRFHVFHVARHAFFSCVSFN